MFVTLTNSTVVLRAMQRSQDAFARIAPRLVRRRVAASAGLRRPLPPWLRRRPDPGQHATTGPGEDGGMERSSRDWRLALTPAEAAHCVGVGRSYFYSQILPELRVVRRGRKTLVPIAELDRWLSRNLTRIA
jgi:excisionase family DNA binding protein